MTAGQTRESTFVQASSAEPEAALLEKLRRNVEASEEAPDLDALRKQAAQIIDMLIAARTAHSAATAATIEALFEKGKLNRLVDEKGRSAASEAVETLVCLGFPYALHVTPADLDLKRRANRRARIRTWLKRTRNVLCIASGLLLLLAWFSPTIGRVAQNLYLVLGPIIAVLTLADFRLKTAKHHP